MDNCKEGKLYVVATPIGNLSDLSPRAADALKSADLIAAEDTRNTLHLLNRFEIKTPLTSYHEHNKYEKAEELITKMKNGCNIAVVTDAGTPCISDPGEELVRLCAEEGITATPVPGPSALITALCVSGLPTRRFVFEGFLPSEKQKKERAKALARLKDETRTIILYEAPHHLKETLKDLVSMLGGERRVTLARELTKVHEEIRRTTLKEACGEEPRGEYVLVIEGKPEKEVEEEKRAAFEDISVEEHVKRFEELGMNRTEAMKAAARERGVSKRDIYALLNKGG